MEFIYLFIYFELTEALNSAHNEFSSGILTSVFCKLSVEVSRKIDDVKPN